MIFEAFDRFDPHVYSFYLTAPGSKARNRFIHAEEYTHPAAIEDSLGFSQKKMHDASQTEISALGLKAKDKFEYLFDFGDEWLHEITVEKILDLFPKKDYPLISKTNGESPPQYPEYDEEDSSLYNETDVDTMRRENSMILDVFRSYLESRNLSEKTVNKHCSNVEFYINEFLLYEELLGPGDGVREVGSFLGDWFIRKAMWASVTSIKENITSLKHFYTFLSLLGEIEEHELAEMKKLIKESKADWIETLQKYDDPNVSMDDIW